MDVIDEACEWLTKQEDATGVISVGLVRELLQKLDTNVQQAPQTAPSDDHVSTVHDTLLRRISDLSFKLGYAEGVLMALANEADIPQYIRAKISEQIDVINKGDRDET